MKHSKTKIKANTVRVDERNIVGIDIGKRKHAATAVSPKGVTLAQLKTFENNRKGVDQLERMSFCGLDPSEYKSGDSIQGRTPISKRGSSLLRWAMSMSAITVCKKHHDFKRIFDRHAHRGYRYAMIAVAHKLARVIWCLMKDNRDFTKRPPKRTAKT